MDAPLSPAPASAGSPTNPPNGSPQGYPAETGAGEPRVLAVDLALEIAPLWRRTDTAADAALSPHEDALTDALTAWVREAA